jgi:uncharacterized membrane protein YbaN (DUF454 family)
MRWAFLAFGWLFVALGFLGAFLPVVPTVPFLILAAYFFSKGSTRLHQWLLDLPNYGPQLRAWEEHGVVRTRAKALATTLIYSSCIYTFGFSNWALQWKLAHLAVITTVVVWLLLRPSSVEESTARKAARNA